MYELMQFEPIIIHLNDDNTMYDWMSYVVLPQRGRDEDVRYVAMRSIS